MRSEVGSDDDVVGVWRPFPASPTKGTPYASRLVSLFFRLAKQGNGDSRVLSTNILQGPLPQPVTSRGGGLLSTGSPWLAAQTLYDHIDSWRMVLVCMFRRVPLRLWFKCSNNQAAPEKSKQGCR